MPPKIVEGATKLGYVFGQLIQHFVSPGDESTGRLTGNIRGDPPENSITRPPPAFARQREIAREAGGQRAEEADTETLQWRGFFESWHKQYGNTPQTARELVDLAVEHELVMDVPGASRSLGKRLQAIRGRVFAEHRIVSQRVRNGITAFALRTAENDGFDGFDGFSTSHIRNEKEEYTEVETVVQKPCKPIKPCTATPQEIRIQL
jgi:hypothetical protein